MSRIKLDLSQFKHVSSDDKTTTLKHKQGHTLTLAHKSLSKEAQEQLAGLSKISKDTQTKDQKEEKEANSGRFGKVTVKEDPVQPLGKVIKKAEGGEIDQDEPVQQYAEGTPNVQPVRSENPELQPQAPIPVDTTPAVDPGLQEKRQVYNQLINAYVPNPQESLFGPNGEEPKKFDADRWNLAEEYHQKNQQTNLRAAEAQGAKQQAENQARLSAGLSPLPSLGAAPIVKTDVPGVQPTSGLAPTQVAPGAKDGLDMSNIDPSTSIMKGIQTQMHGIDLAAKAQGALGEKQAALQESAAQAQANAQKAYQDSVQNLEGERQAHMQDVRDSLVNPDKYWTGDPKTGQGGHSKIMAGIGMILAGFNPTGQPNAAIGFLQHQMNMNLRAQEANLGAHNNLLAANLRQFGNLRDASDMTRVMQNDVVGHMLDAQAQKAQSGPNGLAAAAAMQAKGALMRESAQVMSQMSIRQAMMKLSDGNNGNPTDTSAAEQMINMLYQYNPEMAKSYAKRVVPGIGVSMSQEIPDDVRKELIGKKVFDQAARGYVDWVRKHSGSLNPATIKQGAAMAAELQGLYRNSINGGVYKEGEQQFIEKLIPSDPSQWGGSIRTIPKVEEIIRNNMDKFNSTKSGYGIPVQAPSPQAPQPVTGKDGKQYIERLINGKSYHVPVRTESK